MIKKVYYAAVYSTILFVVPLFTLAQYNSIGGSGSGGSGSGGAFSPTGGAVGTTITNLTTFFNGKLIPFILAVGFLFFVWGMFLYFIKGAHDEDSQKKGKDVIKYALAGFVLIFIFWGLIQLLVNFTNLGGAQGSSVQTPTVPRGQQQ